ncbi:hypothetical protein [Rhodococcus sp. JT-3]|uniref:hypothetical protein n=1 Tax=Rhodococcus sp. JT-3 TaxID=1973213 RepID=UPI0013030B3D|nr:hypothetical protein [Rhodococcus sp. JT-3]
MTIEVHFVGDGPVSSMRYYPDAARLDQLESYLSRIAEGTGSVSDFDRMIGYSELGNSHRLRTVLVDNCLEQTHGVNLDIEHPIVAMLEDRGGLELTGDHLEIVQALPRSFNITVPWSQIVSVNRFATRKAVPTDE